MRDASFGPLVSLFFFLSYFLIQINVLLHIVSTEYVTKGEMEGSDDKKGPNDTRCVVRALVRFFSFIFF